MVRWLSFLAACAAAWAQNPADLFSKAPPAVDNALRERVTAFYQAHVDGKFRAADRYVAEDSKDVFFEADKRRCNSFEIARINYLNEFKKASVVIICDTQMMVMPVGVRPVKVPITSTWKQVDGVWMWYLDPSPTRQSPFGELKPGPPMPGGAVPELAAKGPDVRELMQSVTVDPQEVRFPFGEGGTREVVVSSRLQVEIKLGSYDFPGITVEIERPHLKGGESSRVRIRYDPNSGARLAPGRYTTDIPLRVEPLGRALPVRVLLDPQPN